MPGEPCKLSNGYRTLAAEVSMDVSRGADMRQARCCFLDDHDLPIPSTQSPSVPVLRLVCPLRLATCLILASYNRFDLVWNVFVVSYFLLTTAYRLRYMGALSIGQLPYPPSASYFSPTYLPASRSPFYDHYVRYRTCLANDWRIVICGVVGDSAMESSTVWLVVDVQRSIIG